MKKKKTRKKTRKKTAIAAAAPEKRLLSRAFILSDGKIISEDRLNKAAVPRGRKAGETAEIVQSPRKTGNEFVEPALPLSELSSLLERSTPQYRAVKAKAGDAVVRGWSLEAADGIENPNEANRQRLREFFEFGSARGQSIESTLENMVIDLESLGNGALEVVREEDGTPKEINHIPAKTIRRAKDFSKFKHERGRMKVFYKAIEGEVPISKDDGSAGESIPFVDQANDLIYLVKYSPNSDFYGMPDVVPALRSVTGDLFQKEFNLAFFENGAIPAYMVVIEGAELDANLQTMIEDFFKFEMKGQAKQHRTMILPIPIEGVKVTIERVTPEINEGSFRLFHETAVDEILSANGVPPLRAFMQKPGAFGRDQSREINKVYKESVIDPLQRLIEATITKWIIRDGFEINDWIFRLKPLGFEERELASLAAERLAKTKAVSPNEIRRFISPLVPGGLEDVEGGDEITVEVGGVPTPIEEAFPGEKAHDHDGECLSWKSLFDPEAEVAGSALAEWDGTKQDELLEVMRALNPIVNRLAVKLRKIFAKAEADILANLQKSAGGRLAVFLGFEKQVNVISVLRDFDRTEVDIEEAIVQDAAVAYQSGVELAARKVGVDIAFSLQRPAVQQYLDETVKPFSAKISAGISNRVRRQLAEGIAQGEPIQELAKRVKKVFASAKEKRALLIARTESARAHNIGTANGYVQSGVVKGVEVSDGLDFDGPCIQANGQKWDLARAKANPIQHPNCIRAFLPITIGPGERRL